MAKSKMSVDELADKLEVAASTGAAGQEISIDRLAVDLFRHITFTFRVKPEVIPKATLPENTYPSENYIRDIARPNIFYSIACRDVMKRNFEKFPAENMADRRQDLELIHATLFDTEKESKGPDVNKQFILSLVIATEIIQYLNVKGKRKLLKEMPSIWAKFFKTRLRAPFEAAGGFTEFLSYWEFIHSFDSVTHKFIKLCTPYGNVLGLSDLYKSQIVDHDLFDDLEAQTKILGFEPGSKLEGFRGKGFFEAVNMLGFVPHEFRLDLPVAKGEGDSSEPTGAAASGPDTKKPSKRQKLKPKDGQSYLKYVADRTKLKEKKKDEKQ